MGTNHVWRAQFRTLENCVETGRYDWLVAAANFDEAMERVRRRVTIGSTVAVIFTSMEYLGELNIDP